MLFAHCVRNRQHDDLFIALMLFNSVLRNVLTNLPHFRSFRRHCYHDAIQHFFLFWVNFAFYEQIVILTWKTGKIWKCCEAPTFSKSVLAAQYIFHDKHKQKDECDRSWNKICYNGQKYIEKGSILFTAEIKTHLKSFDAK